MTHRDTERTSTMARRSTFSTIGSMFVTIGSAVAISRAVEAGRRPHPRDLTNLGIEPAAFEKISRYY
jgi:hypothetical protein